MLARDNRPAALEVDLQRSAFDAGKGNGVNRLLFRSALLSAAAAGAVLGSRVAGQEPPSFPARVELVRIDVVVLDHDGRPVTGLTAADFEIREGGRPHEIASFEPVVVRPAPTPASTEPPAPPRV